jgi:hypothetical protein
MKIGDKVKHVNTGEHIYTIIRLSENIATLKRPKELCKKLNPKSKSSHIVDVSICDVKNLLIVKYEEFEDCLTAREGAIQVHEITLSGKCLRCNKQVIKLNN